VTSSGGVGVLAEDSAGTGVALQVAGRAVFSRAGHGLISGTSTSGTVYPPGGLTGSSTVLAILQTALPGVWVTSAVPNVSNGTATINLSQAPGAGKTVLFAWFVVN
jgi:predicted ATPase